MGIVKDRLQRLEEQLMRPSAEEYLVTRNRERRRALHTLAERLKKCVRDGGHPFTEHSLRVLAEDTPERRERDRETVEAWYWSQGLDRA